MIVRFLSCHREPLFGICHRKPLFSATFAPLRTLRGTKYLPKHNWRISIDPPVSLLILTLKLET